MPEDTTDQIYGCLIGGAIGDAIAAPVEGWSYERIRREYGKVDEFKPYYMPYAKSDPGTITSDTTLRQYLCLAIAEKGQRITPDDFGDVLREHLNPTRVWVNEEIVVKKLSVGISPWNTGRGTIQDSKIIAAIPPIGIINACDPEQAYQDGFIIASIFQDDFHRDAAGTVAAGIATAFDPDATLEDVLETMMSQSNSILFRAMDLTMDLAERSDSVDDFVDAFYEKYLNWRWPAVQWDKEKFKAGEVFSASAVEVVPVAMAMLYLCDGDVNESIVESANFGRDSDAIAMLAGSIAGVLSGAGAIRESWIEKCEAANTDFFEELEDDPDANFRSMATRLETVLENERDAAGQRVQKLDRLLERD